ncbi:MAG TPA: serine/threonine-protein kinase [Ktedonobacterales bacterium]
MMLSNPEDLVGRIIGGYRLDGKLGAGATGVVFSGRSVAAPQERVAIKLLVVPFNASAADRAQFEKRFRREAETLQRLRHPRILSLLAFGEEAGFFYMVLPYLAGGTLATRLTAQRGPLPLNEVARYLSEVSSALDYAHGLGVVHRDIKPGNILLDAQGQPYLADFSIARLLGQSRTNLTQPGQVLGTLEYLSPEQAGGEEATSASDIYSLGVVVYELVTGRVPFQRKSFDELFKKHAQEPPPPPRTIRPELPEAAEAVIVMALAKRPEDRFASAGAFAQAFALGLQGQWPPGVQRPTAPETLPFTPPRTINVPPRPVQAPTLPGALSASGTHPQQGGGQRRRMALLLSAMLAVLLVVGAGVGVYVIVQSQPGTQITSTPGPTPSSTSTTIGPTATPTPNATATAVATLLGRYDTITRETPSFFDPLNNPATSAWGQGTSAQARCKIENGGFHFTTTGPGILWNCFDHSGSKFANFVYRVRLVISRSGGGISFRANSQVEYRFHITQDGEYCVNIGKTNTCVMNSQYVNTGVNRVNTIAVLADGMELSFFINDQYITTVLDDASSNGIIGVTADASSSQQADVVFNDAAVWTL